MPPITFSGIASGIDGDAVIKALTDARRTASLPLRNKVEDNDKESKALEELSTKLLSLSDLLKPLQTSFGGAISKVASSSDSEAVGVVASANAQTSSVTVNVEQVARPASFSFNDQFAAVTDLVVPGLTGSETIQITLGSGDKAQTYAVAVDSTTTLSGLADRINEATGEKLRASVVNVGTESAPSHILLLNGAETGIEEGTLTVQVPDAIKSLGRFNEFSLEQAQNAVFTVSGIGRIERSTNQITGLLPGVALSLKKPNSGPVQISVGNDTEKTAAAVESFVKGFNEIVEFVRNNDKIERVEDEKKVTNVFGSLARSRVDNSVLTALREAVAGTVSGATGSEVRVLADLGITTQRDGTLGFKRETFEQAMSKDTTAVGELLSGFADRVSTTNGVIAGFTRFQGQIDLALDGNESENRSLNGRLEQIERSIEKYTEQLKKSFTNLETTISQLNSTQGALVSLIQGNGSRPVR